MLKFPRKEKGKKGKSDGRKGKIRERKKERKDSGKNGAVCRERRRNCVRRNDIATRKEKILLSPEF